LLPSAVVFTSDSETSTGKEEISEPESSDDKKQVTCGIKLIKNQAVSLSLQPQV
jgi:hypothetical protein